MARDTSSSTLSVAPARAGEGGTAGFTDEPSGQRATPRRTLASATPAETVKVVGLSMEEDLREWLAAVGIGIGETLTLLRRAAFGGPLHVRTSAGGEFALNVALARSVFVEPEASGVSDGPRGGTESSAA